MMKFCIFVIISLIITQVLTKKNPTIGTIEKLHSFSKLDFQFDDPHERDVYFRNGHYKNCAIAGIKVDSSGNIYVSIPRWKPNVPATLAKVVIKDGKTLLDPYPSWDMNAIGNVNALQSVLGFEIDEQDRMWILDQGKIAGQKAEEGAIKLIVWDIKKHELIHHINFTEDIASRTRSFLNDIVVDDEEDIAYITDSGISIFPNEAPKPGLIVVRVGDDIITRHLDSHETLMPRDDLWLKINGKYCLENEPMRTGADGIALSCDGQRLYWTPLTSHEIYGIQTDLLLMYEPGDIQVERAIVHLGNKTVASDGLASSSKSLLITGLETNQIYTVDETENLKPFIMEPKNFTKEFQSEMKPLIQSNLYSNESHFIWPDTLGFHNGWLYVVTNNLCDFVQDKLDFEKNNYFIYRIFIDEEAYYTGCTESFEMTILEYVLFSSLAGVFVISVIVSIIVGRITENIKNKRIRSEYEQIQ